MPYSGKEFHGQKLCLYVQRSRKNTSHSSENKHLAQWQTHLPATNLKKKYLFRILAYTCTSVTPHSLTHSLTQESHPQNILDFLQFSIQGEHILKFRRCATSNIQTSTATLHVVLWTNFIHTHIIFENIHHLYWRNCSTRKLAHRSPLWRNPNQVHRFNL